jgi:hypothetical protein
VKKIVTSRKLKKVEIGKFKADVHEIFTTHSDTVTPELYHSTLCSVLDALAPLVSRRVAARLCAPWMTPEIIQAKKDRRHAEHTWRTSGLTVHREIFVHKEPR